MDDRTLLELAAKAAGLEVIKHCQEARDKSGYGYVGLYVKSNQGELISTGWNPLTDDADALSLAVKLRMAVYFSKSGTVAEAPDAPGPEWEESDYRRAITRAAAEIGKGMQP